MCGVVGWLDHRRSRGLQNDAEAVLEGMRESLVHRGPDDFGSWLSQSGQVALANRRLSIVDLSERARQPMVSETADIVLSYNGEVYNHLELRHRLKQLGYRFRSDCDTETVLYAFEEWGIDCITRFKGQFAFAVWDGRTQTMYLARDRVGLQPMYFYSKDGLVVFGSEIRSILRHPAVEAEINFGAMYQFLVMHAPAPPFTVLKSIYAVPAGAYVSCRAGEMPRLQRYWTLLDEVGKHDFTGRTELQIADQLRETLMEAVRRRMMSDRPVGLFLSGGVDSTSLLACMAALGFRDVKSFSIGYADEQTRRTADEFDFARTAAKEFESTHTLLRSNPTRLEEFANTCDLPIENLAEFWLWEMAESAKRADVSVMLHGEGADELLFGYDFHWNVLSEREHVQRDPRHALDLQIDSGIPQDLWSAAKGNEDRDAIADLMFWGGGVHPSLEYERHKYLSPEHISAQLQPTPGLDTSKYHPVSDKTDVLSFMAACYAEARSSDHGTDYRQRMQYLEFVYKLPEVLLRRGERSCMKNSVELRVPFLDEDMIALAVNLPIKSLRAEQTVKYPLRMAMKGMVPERIRNRPKEFFGVSFLDASSKWPAQNDWFRYNLLESDFTSLGLVSKAYLEQRYEHVSQDNSVFETFLWKQVFTAVWFDNMVTNSCSAGEKA